MIGYKIKIYVEIKNDHFMIRKSALYHDADISNTVATTQQHNNNKITTK